MLRFFQKVNQLINSQFPKNVILSECELRRILALYDEVAPDAIWQYAITRAIHRIYGQLDLYRSCSCLKLTILLYEEDIQALKILVNNHCMTIADIYAEAEGLMAYYAEKQYEAYTKLMLRIR